MTMRILVMCRTKPLPMPRWGMEKVVNDSEILGNTFIPHRILD